MNSTLGHIPLSEDRSVFEMRSIIYSCRLNFMIREFEQEFIGNNLTGFKFNVVLSQLVDDYELWLKSDRKHSLDYWFDLSMFAKVYNESFKAYPMAVGKYSTTTYSRNYQNGRPYNMASLINRDSRYLMLKRNDLKLAPITLSVKYTSSYHGLDSLNPMPSYNPDGTVTVSNSPYHLATGYTIVGFLRDFLITARDYTPVNLDHRYTIPLTSNADMSVNSWTPNLLLRELRKVCKAIAWLESKSSSMNIGGNTDGLKINEYEEILEKQLSYLNGLTDAIQSALIEEKVAHQVLKDEVTLKINEAKKELASKIQTKAMLIKELKEITGIIA